MRRAEKGVVLIFLLLFLPFLAFSQSKKELEAKRQQLLKDIKSTSKMLDKTAQRHEATLDRFVVLQKQISQREELILTLEAEIMDAESAIQRNQNVIAALETDVSRAKNELGKTLRAAFRKKKTTNPLLFVLSAESLNQAFRRLIFLRKYNEGRARQAEAIAFAQKMLARKIGALQDRRLEKGQLLAEATGQQQTLGFELENKEVLLKTLETDAERLKTELKTKETAHEKLNLAIEKIIRDEVAKRLAEARKPKKEPAPAPAEKPKKSPAPTAENPVSAPPRAAPEDSGEAEFDAESTDFAKMRGRLPWPVADGFISKSFGKQPHPTLKGIEITNNGIDIRCEAGEQVRAVAGGRVAGVQFVPGHDNLLIVQHGDFYTVYSNLSEVWVRAGQTIDAKHALGRVRSEDSELHFEVWRQKERLNPAGWIKK